MLPLRFYSSSPASPRLLCLGAHCDDIEIGCGGTLLRLLQAHPNSEVSWVVFSSTPERACEAEASAKAFTAATDGPVSITVHDFRDGYLPQDWAELKDLFEKIKLEFNPDVILTPHTGDAHQDHRTVGELTWNTFRDHVVLEYEIPKYDGDLGRPNWFVPLDAATLAHKIRLLRKHFPSQETRPWFDAETFRSICRLRGLEAGSGERYAEAFHCRKSVLWAPSPFATTAGEEEIR